MEVRDGDASIRHLDFLFAEYEPRCYLVCRLRVLPAPGAHGPAHLHLPRVGDADHRRPVHRPDHAARLVNIEPAIEDADDYLANLGQFQIVLVFLASMVLLVKRMPEQDGAPGNIFKGPLFAEGHGRAAR